jgi:hypothetical protein
MTFLVAFARPEFALLASDTRTTRRSTPDGPATGFDDAGVKVRPTDTGWLAAGPSMCWRDAMLAGTSPADAMRELEAESPAMAELVRERQLTFTIGTDASGCFRDCVDWFGAERFPGPQHLAAALCPNGSDPATLQRLLNGYQAAIKREPLPIVLEATARLYAAVYVHCGPRGTVSPLLTIGLVDAAGRRELLEPQPHDAFLREAAHV